MRTVLHSGVSSKAKAGASLMSSLSFRVTLSPMLEVPSARSLKLSSIYHADGWLTPKETSWGNRHCPASVRRAHFSLSEVPQKTHPKLSEAHAPAETARLSVHDAAAPVQNDLARCMRIIRGRGGED